MATHGAAQPSTKKRSFLLRDFFKLFRAISRVLPREKSNHIHKASKHERKLRTKSKDHEEQIFNVSDDPNAFRFQESKPVANKVEGANFCKGGATAAATRRIQMDLCRHL
ncbi:BnaA05g18650D [Brassica napus]|uniref:BnaA05g18650D protein n=1 Tax=Brassica napus TaxID=3708 RepID=A0A078I405_BRANA|nr:BnaA05g18650D [Brassica napus]